jgi:biotin operon repressor
MAFERSLTIERRLARTLDLIQAGCHSTPSLAKEIGVSIPTISRIVAALKNRGFKIESIRTRDGWRYVLVVDGQILDAKNHGGVR